MPAGFRQHNHDIYLKKTKLRPQARFSKAQETLLARKAIFSQSVFTPETSSMKRTSVHVKNMYMKQLWSHKVWSFAAAFRYKNF